MPNNPSVLGLRFVAASSGSPFNLTGSKRIYVGPMGIINLDSVQHFTNVAQLYTNGSQIWDAAGGPLLIGNTTHTLIRLGARGSSAPRFIPESSVLTITGNHNVTINGRIEGNGAIIKEGNGTLFLNNSTNSWSDSDWPWTPAALHETLRIHRGTVQMGSNATLANTTRVFIAQHPTATWALNDRPLVIANLNGGGTLDLANASLTLTHDFVLNSSNNSTIGMYVAPTNFRGRIQGGVSGNVVLTTRAGSQNLTTTLSGNSTFLGRVQVMSGNLIIGHSNALGAAGAGNETEVPNGPVVILNGNGMNIPETLSHNAANTVALINQRG
ncbi:MAG: hypothetical protein N2035_10510, partial [Chthoniobacterales bacterium]|nr:hypothetical protein [Chthoniobacterales bacterium]